MPKRNIKMFEQFTNHDDQYVQKVAKKLEIYNQMYENKQISYDEFQELAQDVLDLEKINQLASNLERQILIKQVVELMIKIIQAIPKPF